jgi:hypothetical protein
MSFEFPDPVVANFLAQVRSIPPQRDDLRRARMRPPNGPPVTWRHRLLLYAIDAMLGAVFAFTIASKIWLVQPRAAKQAYRAMDRDLKRAGWSLQRRVTVSHALYAVRHRDLGEPAARLYLRTMEPFIPRLALGWT